MKITFYFDVWSPYTYFGWKLYHRNVSQWEAQGARCEAVPFFLAGIMAASHNVPPASVPNKALFMASDLERNKRYFGTPEFLGVPANFFEDALPAKGIFLQRFLASAKQVVSRDQFVQVTNALFHLIWEDKSFRSATNSLRIPSESDLHSIIVAQGIEPVLGRKILEDAKSNGKELLRGFTQNAVDVNSFGSPTITVESSPHRDANGLYFGSDRLEQMCALTGLSMNRCGGVQNCSRKPVCMSSKL